MADEKILERREKRRDMMLNGKLVRVIPSLAIPMIISMLIDSFYNLADTYFVSQIGIYATAAVGINDSLTFFMRSIALGFGMGASSYISRLLGAKRDEDACRVATTTMYTSIIFLSVFALISYMFISPIVSLLGATESSKTYAIEYAKFFLISAPFTAGEVSMSQSLRAEGSAKYSMFGMVSGCFVNLALDPLLISVLGMGVAGAAISTTISKAVSFFVLLAPYVFKKSLLEIKPKYFTPKKEIYSEVAKMGVPSFLRGALVVVSQVIMNRYAGSFGDTALAAVSVGAKCTRFVASGIMGFGQGYQPLAGYCWGAKHYGRVRSGFYTCCLLGLGAASILGIVMIFAAPWLVEVFAPGETEVIEIGTVIIRSQCITMAPHIWVMVVNGLFQALGKPMPATLISLSRQALCLVPCIIILSAWIGVYGLAISQAVSDILSLALCAPFLVHQFKELKRLENETKLSEITETGG